jgi:CHAT domain-containing protein
MNHRCTRAIAAAIGALCFSAFVSAALLAGVQADQDVTVLEPGKQVERELARGQEHLYQLALTTGECVSVIVEQRGIDVIVQVRGADGSAIADVQDEIRREGQEQVDVVADAAGTYTLAITAAPNTALPDASYAIHVASRRAATDADRSMQEARRLRTAAIRLGRAAKTDQERPLLERALTISEAVRGPDDVFVGELLFQLAGNALESREDARAESLYQRAITVLEKTWGAEHPYPAMARSRLALLLQHAGQGPKAEALLRQATDVIERTLGPDHPWLAVCLNTEADLRGIAGDLDTAEPIYRRALAILDKVDDTNTAAYAALLNNLGDVYRQREDYARAEELFRRALTLTEKLEGSESFHISIDYQNLGIIARQRKDYATAEEYTKRALAIRERAVGADHPDIAPLLNNLANIQHATGNDLAALQTYVRALRIWEKTLGPYHRGTLTGVGNMARTYASAGDLANAVTFQRRADVIIEKQLEFNLAIGSERQKLAFVNSVSERTERTISLSLNEASGDPDASALAALVLLQRKGRVLDVMIDTFAAVRQRVADPADQSLLDQLRATIAQLAQRALTAPGERHQEQSQSLLKELETQKERLEVELSEHSAEFRAQLQPVTLDAVESAMPDEAALVEFAVFRPFDPKAERNAEAYGAPHYAAYVVRKHAPPHGQDLGPAGAIDEAIDALRQALRDPKRADLKQRARAVDEQVIQPLRASLGDATRLLVSPDGDLNLVPFEALVDEHGRYLIERYAMSYLTSGRDLLRMQVARVNHSKPVIVADPFFGEPAMAMAKAEQPRRLRRRSVTTGQDTSTLYFAPLAGTAEEAREIKALFPEATLFTGRRATKATLERLEAPRMLHIASHGFFLQDAAHDTADTPATAAAPAASGTRAISASVKVENPLLRSGLALAGANLTRSHNEDGILTALEASGLNLWGTKLVTLSACDTGVGEVRNGEGVYGLRRAFVLAGAETLVMSLWPVSDYVTREMMTAYYTGLRAGLGRGDALRQAKLAILKKKGRQHPFYWASFIQSGEWASLDGKR